MSGYVIKLRGCTPEPLGNYLKGLGVFRLITEQADPEARAWWREGYLHIYQSKWVGTGAEVEGHLSNWLLDGCQFTPLIAPWQTGTGYLNKGKRTAGGDALSGLLGLSHRGTESFRDVFKDFARALSVELPEDPAQWPKVVREKAPPDLSDAEVLRLLRNRLENRPSVRWLDAVGVSASRSRESDNPSWFPILANGGGEASGQYIVNHQQRLLSLLRSKDDERSQVQLESTLFGMSPPGALEAKAMGAMYYPSLMKAPNVGQDFIPDPERRVNPWDFVFLLEGTVIWSMTVTRRKGVTPEKASFPFYCRSSFGGSVITVPKEVEGAEGSIANGEIWCPIWRYPATLYEVQRIFGEGRLQVGDQVITRGLDFALAMMGVGVDRGIHAFYRYSLLERSGSGRQTTLLAVPSGCFVPQRALHVSLLADLRDFAQQISQFLVDSSQLPRRLTRARVEFEQAWFNSTVASVSARQDPAPSLEELLLATGRLMCELGTNATRPGVVKIKRGSDTIERTVMPVRPLRREWASLSAGKQTPEYCLARAVGSIGAWGTKSGDKESGVAVEAIRANLLPVMARGRRWEWDDTSRSAVWARGAALEANLASVLRRRLIDAQRGVGKGLPLWSSFGANFKDLLAFWSRGIDEARIADLIHGLALIETPRADEPYIDRVQKNDQTPDLATSGVWFLGDEPKLTPDLPDWLGEKELEAACRLPRVYHLLKLCFTGGRLPPRLAEGRTGIRAGNEAHPSACLDVLTLLESGRLAEATQLASLRLRAKGYPSALRDADIHSLRMVLDDCRRLAGMLMIPVRHMGVCAALAIKPQSIS